MLKKSHFDGLASVNRRERIIGISQTKREFSVGDAVAHIRVAGAQRHLSKYAGPSDLLQHFHFAELGVQRRHVGRGRTKRRDRHRAFAGVFHRSQSGNRVRRFAFWHEIAVD